MPAPKDLSGIVFGRLTAVRDDGNPNGLRRWIWRCECGTEKSILVSNVRSGKQVSCGCNKIEKATRHGLSGTRTYQIWGGIRWRTSGHHPNYMDVPLCPEWEKFEVFVRDMGECPDGLTIDRIDNSKGYEPGNCRWASRLEQTLNRDCVIWVDVSGDRVSLREACRRLRLPYSTVHHRVKDLGMCGEEALRFKKWSRSPLKAGKKSAKNSKRLART